MKGEGSFDVLVGIAPIVGSGLLMERLRNVRRRQLAVKRARAGDEVIVDPADDPKLGQVAVTVTLDKKAKEWAAEKGYEPVFGARPLKRFLQRHIETKLARALIAGEVGEGSAVKFTVERDELVMAGAPVKGGAR